MSVHRLVASLLLLVPIVTSAQSGSVTPAIRPQPAPLTDEQWDRLLERLDGSWQLDLDKSSYFLTAPPQSAGGGHIYVKDTRCTAPGFLDTRLRYAAWRSSYCSRASSGVRYASFSRRQHWL